MKLYIWNNGGSTSDFQPECNVDMGQVQDYSSDAHSGGIVVLAESLEQACELAVKNLQEGGDYCPTERADGYKYLLTTTPAIVELDKPGLVLYASGNC